MALRLIRQQSDTPNVTNKDDVQMVRYAYGGYNGVVKDFGEELKVEHIAGSGLFFKSGKIVLYGWEVDIDGSGYLLTIPYLSGTYYYSAYLEINAFQETAEIKAVYNPYAQYPNIDNGDDLTQIPNGVAKLLLYNFEVYNGTITTTQFEPKFKIIPYISEAFEDDRLTAKKATYATNIEGRIIYQNDNGFTTGNSIQMFSINFPNGYKYRIYVGGQPIDFIKVSDDIDITTPPSFYIDSNGDLESSQTYISLTLANNFLKIGLTKQILTVWSSGQYGKSMMNDSIITIKKIVQLEKI